MRTLMSAHRSNDMIMRVVLLIYFSKSDVDAKTKSCANWAEDPKNEMILFLLEDLRTWLILHYILRLSGPIYI
jgi:hypothetical protein